MERSRVLLVDDDPGLLRLLGFRLRSAGYDVEAVDSGPQALDRLPKFQPQVVITDLRMDGMDGMALFDRIHAQRPTLPVIVLTAHGSIPDAVQATQRGLYGYFTKPCDSERLLGCVDRALRVNGAAPSDASDPWEESVVGRSAAMRSLLEQARLAARSDSPVVLTGAVGSGKTLLARTLHAMSARAGRPFVVADGAAAAPFAAIDRDALHGGTLYVRAVDAMAPARQDELLRLLADADEAGSPWPHLRIVVASGQDLHKLTATGAFREDLFYRLDVVRLAVPSLAERRDDIPLLARHFLRDAVADPRAPAREFAPDALEVLLSAPWPGNVRQLENVVRHCATLCTTSVIPRSLLAGVVQADAEPVETLNTARARFERQYLERVLRETSGNVSAAARLAGRDRSKFYKLLHRHDLEPESFRSTR